MRNNKTSLFGWHALVLLSVAVLHIQCIEIRDALGPGGLGLPDGGTLPPLQPGTLDGEPDAETPSAFLAVSNPNPLAGEEVELICSLVTGGTGSVTYDFQPPEPRLVVNRRTGFARLLVDEVDIGAEFAFTCSATTDAGVSERSNEVVIIAGG